MLYINLACIKSIILHTTIILFIFAIHTKLYSWTVYHTPFPIRPESGARDYKLGLIDLFFLRAELVPVVIQTISVITKIIFIYKKNYHQSGVHQNLYTYTESHLLIHVYFFSNTKHQRSRKQCAEHLSLTWPALLMWDVLSSILVFCFCNYKDLTPELSFTLTGNISLDNHQW